MLTTASLASLLAKAALTGLKLLLLLFLSLLLLNESELLALLLLLEELFLPVQHGELLKLLLQLLLRFSRLAVESKESTLCSSQVSARLLDLSCLLLLLLTVSGLALFFLGHELLRLLRLLLGTAATSFTLLAASGRRRPYSD